MPDRKPDPMRDTTGQLSRKGQDARAERERHYQRELSPDERAAKQRAEDRVARTSTGGSDDIVGESNSQAGTGGGNLPGPEDR